MKKAPLLSCLALSASLAIPSASAMKRPLSEPTENFVAHLKRQVTPKLWLQKSETERYTFLTELSSIGDAIASTLEPLGDERPDSATKNLDVFFPEVNASETERSPSQSDGRHWSHRGWH